MKILILTSVYPQPDDDKGSGVTPVIHYFAKEWAKVGHEVIVIHNANKYPLPIYLLPNSIKQIINSKIGMILPKFCQRKDLFSIKDNIKIYRCSITKFFLKGKFLNCQINSQFKKIIKILNYKDNKFTPDLIVGHWENPQIPLISMLKNKFGSKTALVLHGVGCLNKEQFKIWQEKYIKNIDIIGGRSINISTEVREILNLNYQPFVCYSGIPDNYIKENIINNINIKKRQDDYVYVGRLIERKNVDTIIKALKIAYPDKNFTFNIIGTGAMKQQLMDLVKDLGLEKNINFLNRLSRNDAINVMKNSKCLTMVSKNEVFGLVYLEALACGCIVIASKDEGIDGVIIDGINGFLCEEGNVEQLSRIYTNIKNMDDKCIEKISMHAMNTAKDFTDSKVAKRYLKQII